MKNTYDILVNFKKRPYDFFEWNKSDDIKNIRVIPTIKVNDDCMYSFLKYNLFVKNSFLKIIESKTEALYNHVSVLIKYACVIFNEEIALALEFNDKGVVIGKSRLLYDEEEDIISNGNKLPIVKIDYKLISKNNNNDFCTRNEQKNINIILSYLDNTYKNEQIDMIKYMYFECFNENEFDFKKSYKKLKDSVLNLDFEAIDKLKSLIKVLKK